MKPNEQIRARRKAMGLHVADVAKKAGVGDGWYRDIEAVDGEACTHTPLRALRAICLVLGLDLLSLFGIPCMFCSEAAVAASVSIPRNRLIKEQRLALGLTQKDLGDRIGFEVTAIEDMENDPDYLEGWPIELIENLATILKVPMHALLGVPCMKCGRGGR